jgi:hypothetical protein
VKKSSLEMENPKHYHNDVGVFFLGGKIFDSVFSVPIPKGVSSVWWAGARKINQYHTKAKVKFSLSLIN